MVEPLVRLPDANDGHEPRAWEESAQQCLGNRDLYKVRFRRKIKRTNGRQHSALTFVTLIPCREWFSNARYCLKRVVLPLYVPLYVFEIGSW